MANPTQFPKTNNAALLPSTLDFSAVGHTSKIDETDTVEAGDCDATKLRIKTSHREPLHPVSSYSTMLMLQQDITDPVCKKNGINP
jgi:hypothetical protein